MNFANLGGRGRDIEHERDVLRARDDFEFCDPIRPGGPLASARTLPADCENLVSHVVMASTEDNPDEIGRALGSSSRCVHFMGFHCRVCSSFAHKHPLCVDSVVHLHEQTLKVSFLMFLCFVHNR
jgi:hypothetical protein